jgi:hypothetical protein
MCGLTVCVTRAGAGDGEAVQLGKCYGVEKCLEFRQNPQRRVHALLACLLNGAMLILQHWFHQAIFLHGMFSREFHIVP